MATDIEKTLKDARIAAACCVGCVILIGLLFMVDGQRNRAMLDHVQEARRILEEFRQAVAYATGGTVTAAPVVGGGAADSGGTGGDGAAGVVADARPGTGMDQTGDAAAVPVNGTRAKRAGMAGGPRGDG